MSALALCDLQEIDGEPRVLDLKLAEALDFRRPRKIREIIERHLAELETHGYAPRRGAMVEIGSGARREVFEYLLNEPQALLICMFARTAKAAAVRKQVIDVFMAWRRGHLLQTEEKPAAGPDRAQVAKMKALYAQLNPRYREAFLARALQEALEAAPEPCAADDRELLDAEQDFLLAFSAGERRSPIFKDREILRFLVSRHLQAPAVEVLRECRRRFGARAPSASALSRFMQKLDGLRRSRLYDHSRAVGRESPSRERFLNHG
jgi:hypothetical protein